MKPMQKVRYDQHKDVDSNVLVARAREGCEECLSELARRYFPKLVQLVLPRVANRSHMDAEDVAQESLLKAFRNLDSFDPQYRFSTWLYTIAIRVAIDSRRGTQRRSSLLAAHCERADATSICSYASIEQRESLTAIWQTARRALNDTQYTAMWLRFAEDLSIGEIASIMRKTQVGVRVALHRARMTMLKELSDEEFTGPVRHPAGEEIES